MMIHPLPASRLPSARVRQIPPAAGSVSSAARARALPCSGDAIRGRHVHLVGARNLADNIGLLRFVRLVADQAASVTLEATSPLSRLAGSVDARVKVLRPGTAPGRLSLNLSDVPVLLGPDAAERALAIPYLSVPFDAIASFERVLAGESNWMPRIGIAASFQHDAAADALRQLPRIPGIAWITALFGGGQDRVGGLVRDLADTAALMECLDLVITSDRLAAALAGALGKPVWFVRSEHDIGDSNELEQSYPSLTTVAPGGSNATEALAARVRGWYNERVDALVAAADRSARGRR